MLDRWTGQVDESWAEFLTNQNELLGAIYEQVAQQQKSHKVLPTEDLVLRCLRMPKNQVAIVIMGQDPYPNVEDACGLAFAVSPNQTKVPGSLRNILNELQSDLGCSEVSPSILHDWADSGVMLLNTCLTVNEGASNSHAGFGWEKFVWNLIEYLSQLNPDLVLVLWGNSAKKYGELVNSKNVVFSAHPSPLSAHRGFIGSKPFSKVNQIMQRQGKAPIHWCDVTA